MEAKSRFPTTLTLVRPQVSRYLSRRLSYYLTPEEAHRLIPATENSRDHFFLRLLWETGARVSEALAVRLGDVSRDGIRVLGKGAWKESSSSRGASSVRFFSMARNYPWGGPIICFALEKGIISPGRGLIR